MASQSNAASQSQPKAFQLTPLQGDAHTATPPRVWLFTFDLPGEKVNKLTQSVMQEVDQWLSELETMGREKKIDVLVLLSGKPQGFIAGADIEMIQAVTEEAQAVGLSQTGQTLLNRWEDLPFAKVAVIEGAALGGGCEFALACDLMVMSNSPACRIGLPEVMLGLIPGMGGCVRLPRKVGLANALDLILTGRTLSGEAAARMGLADACLPQQNFRESALQWVVRQAGDLVKKGGKGLAPKKLAPQAALSQSLESWMSGSPLRALIFKKAREGVLAKTKGHYPAPLKALEVLQANKTATRGGKLKGAARDLALKNEALAFGQLAVSPIAKHLIRIFFLTEAVKKSKGVESGSAAADKKVQQAAVLGAGVMGGGIAQLFAAKNLAIRMKDLTEPALAAGITAATQIFQKDVKRRKLTTRQFLQNLNKIAPVMDFSGFDQVDFVIEAVVENLEIKQRVLKELESKISPECIVASNTSSLSISKMQSVLSHPERFVGMHFFNPVSQMPLVEVIRGEKSSDEAVVRTYQLSKQLGKTPIVVKDSPGFLVNRLLIPYLNEAIHLLAEGVALEQIDQVLLRFGMPMGPMELIDEVGIDVGEKVSHILFQAFGERMAPSSLAAKAVSLGRLGKKNNKGLYLYQGAKKTKSFDPEIYQLLGVELRSEPMDPQEILERCVLPMINEAARCLADGVVENAATVDLGMMMGSGFPPFRGGLLRYADELGANYLVQQLRKYETSMGARYAPAAGLLTQMEKKLGFYPAR